MAKRRPELPQGTFDMLVLKALSLGPMHGYGIAQRIQQMAGDLLRVDEGTLYPAVYRIEHRGWIVGKWGSSDNNRRARFYTLTRAGRTHLAAEKSRWESLSLVIRKVLEAT
jgi:PadR family transcriptional regulator PadR